MGYHTDLLLRAKQDSKRTDETKASVIIKRVKERNKQNKADHEFENRTTAERFQRICNERYTNYLEHINNSSNKPVGTIETIKPDNSTRKTTLYTRFGPLINIITDNGEKSFTTHYEGFVKYTHESGLEQMIYVNINSTQFKAEYKHSNEIEPTTTFESNQNPNQLNFIGFVKDVNSKDFIKFSETETTKDQNYPGLYLACSNIFHETLNEFLVNCME